MGGELLLALVFFTSGAVLLKKAASGKERPDSAGPARGGRRSLGFFMVALGVLVSMYWLVMRL